MLLNFEMPSQGSGGKGWQTSGRANWLGDPARLTFFELWSTLQSYALPGPVAAGRGSLTFTCKARTRMQILIDLKLYAL